MGDVKMDKRIFNQVLKNKYALVFAAGFATAVVGKVLLESDAVKEVTSKGMDAVMSAKNDIEETFQPKNEYSQDTVIDINAETKRKINITEDE